MVIKYSSEGEVEWARSIGEDYDDRINSVTETSDGGIIVGGYFESRSITVGDYTLTNAGGSDGMVIKYSSEGEVEWARSIGGEKDESIESVSETSDGGIIVGGYFYGSSITVGEYTLTNNSKPSYYYRDGMVIKYNTLGEVEWARSIGGSSSDYINSISETSDGGIIVGGSTSSGNIIKYNSDGEVEWTGNTGSNIQSVSETSDGGVLVGGYFQSKSITVGDYTLKNNGYDDGMIIKYSSDGEIEWAKSVGGSSNDYIGDVTELSSGFIMAGGYFASSTIETDGYTLTNSGNYDGMLLKIANLVGAPEVQELTVENTRKVFNITTGVNEIDGEKGGSILGEDWNPYEKVKYGDNSIKKIKMTPDEGYEIIGITVNGEEYPFEVNTDGTYTMPQFENVTEDKYVEVTYSKIDNTIKINKIDSGTNEPLKGVTFKLDQIEERTNPDGAIGTFTDNGVTYTEVILDTSNDVTGQVTGELTNNGTYYFVQNEDGTLMPTNSKTYQTAHEGIVGIRNSTANSYVKIDLTELEGKYVVVVNANISSESSDYGYATITQSTTAPSYSSSTGRFMYISGTSSSAKDYISTTALQGGQVYYLHLGYRKDSSVDRGDDQVVINSIKVYGAEEKNSTYNFVSNDQGGYESNNQGQASTVANSYVPIDLTELTGKYNLTVNANVSSQSSTDYGYATVTSSTTAPSYSSSTGRFIYISGTSGTASEPTDYTTVLQGGNMYYLHLGYYKDSAIDSGDDKFTVNSIQITPNDSELYHTEITTNSEGQAIKQIPFGKYQVTEANTPEGYESIEPQIIEFRENGTHEFTIENNKLQRVIVHHYLKNDVGEYTQIKVAEDEVLTGKAGEEYKAIPHLDLDRYELEKDTEGNYKIPENANGTYDDNLNIDQEVTYYYVEKEYSLIVHHYIDGTAEQVTLKDGSLVEDEKYTGKEGEAYTTEAIGDSELNEKFELAQIPTNATGNYIAGETVVTYYYKIVEKPLTITKTREEGTPLEGVKFTVQPKEYADIENTIGKIGSMQQNGTYYFVKENGRYISNNQGQDDTTASSYIKVDLTEKEDVTLRVNAEISSQSWSDYGYVTITDNTTVPSYYDSNGRLIYISGKQSAQDYETTLRGGKVYYIHLCYYKRYSGSNYNDTFTINSINLNGYNVNLFEKETYTTDENGKVTIILKGGENVITEIATHPNYKIPDNPSNIVNVTRYQDSYQLEIVNERKRGTIITHYYIAGTEEKVPSNVEGQVVEDVVQNGLAGDSYSTSAATNVDSKFELESVEGATEGKIQGGVTEIFYYYTLKLTDLTIIKEDENGNRLQGAGINIASDIIDYDTTEETDENGEIKVQVPVGENIITEIYAPDGYRVHKDPINTTLELDKENLVTIANEKINYFDFELNKIDTETKEALSGAKFGLSYITQYGEKKTVNYETSTDGKLSINGLEDEIEYTLEEVTSPKGYVVDKIGYKFKVHYVDGQYNVEMLEGTFDNLLVENNKVSCTISNTPTLKIIKQGEFGELLANAKFTITDEEGNIIVDGDGNEVGQVENIDGNDIRVVTTDSEGKITENLEPGTYILTEVQAPNGYKLPENEEDRVTRIEITSEGHVGNDIEIGNEINLSNLDMSWLDTNKLELVGEIVAIDDQGNLELAGGLVENFTIPAEYTTTGEAITLEKNSMLDGIILTINQEGKVVKAKQVKSPENGGNVLYYTMTNKNGDVLGLGILIGELTIPAEETEKNEAITVSGTGSQDTYTICFNKEGKVKWANNINYIEASNEIDIGFKNDEFVIQYIPDGDTVTVPANSTETGEEIVINMTNSGNPVMIIYNEEGKVSKATEITIPNIDYSASAAAIVKDGGLISATYSEEPIVFDSSETVSGEEIQTQGGITIKYNQEGKVEWAKSISGMSAIRLMKEVSNGYVGIMAYMGEIKVESKDTSSGEEIILDSQSDSEISTAMIKYNLQGQVEWLIDIDFNIDNGYIEPIQLQQTTKGYALLDSENGNIYTFTETPTDLIANQQSLVTITNEAMDSSVIVHHYIEGTTDKLSEDVLVNGKVGSDYTTNVATDIPANYELVAEPSNKNGKMTIDQTEVIYYYRMKQAVIDQTINKSGPEKITNEDEKVSYTMTYTGNVTDYIGKATVTITDTLPYEIDEARSNLDGGLYNEAQKTITWTIDVNDIDTYTNVESGNISITKQIEVVYDNMDYSKTSFENKVQGSIYLEETEQEKQTNEDKVETQTEFTTNVTVTKVWNHTNNIYTIPTQVEVQVKNGAEVVARQIINSSNKVGEDDNTWSYTFTGLPKYDENGELIIYTVDEAEVNSGDLAYYDKQIEGNTITNTYDGPIISAEKTSDTEKGLDYVVEGETITYTITVKNDGGVDKEVKVQDSTPEGTTLKEGSIKVNGVTVGEDNTEAKLENGIDVNVGAHSETTVSFEVTVNPLEGEDLTKVIRNTAIIDGEETEEVTDTVNKSKLVFNKTSETENRLDYVVAGEKITYRVNLNNEGTAPATTEVKDSAPEGTTFVPGSIVVKVDNNQINTEKTYSETELNQGIEVEVPAGKTAEVSFEVTVNDIEDGTIIRNQATVGESEEPNTNETESKYVEPIISVQKTAEEERPEIGYAQEGEKITYIITVINNGGLSKDVEIKDTIPDGTAFVEGSIEVNGVPVEEDNTEAKLENGITVNVPAKIANVAGTAEVSFEVTVNTLSDGLYTKEIGNTAYVDGTPTNNVEVTVNKANIVAHKESEPANGSTVKQGDTITYKIVLDNTLGTAEGTVRVQDSIPEGTTYQDNTMKLAGEPIGNNSEDLENGFNVTVPAGQTYTLEFKVTVNDNESGYEIRNVAIVDRIETNETEHTYVEPIISAVKTQITENSLDYVVEGETITYTITITNTGDLGKDVVVRDDIPEGTSFVEGSVKVNNSDTENAEDNLAEGIRVNVPKRGKSEVSFKVRVNSLADGKYEETIENIANVDGVPTNKVTEEVKKPHVRIGKTSEPASGEKVTQGDEIRYVIVLENKEGTAPITLQVKDSIPEGTNFIDDSIKVNGVDLGNTLEDLTTNGIEVEVPAGETSTVEFKVTVIDLDNGDTIRNKASIRNPETEETKETNEVTHEYVEAVIEAEKEMTTEQGLSYVIPGEEVTYTIRVRNTGDLSKKLTVSDSIPEGTEFVEGSVLLNGTQSNVTKEQLEAGIEVEANGNTEQTISFEVTVLEGATEVKNTAVVDKTPTNETKIPVISYEKTAEVIRQTEEEIPEGTVTAGDKIKYTIRVNNLGEEPVTNITVKDVVPTGTTLSSTSAGAIVNDRNEISWTIDSIAVGESAEVSFEVTVNYDIVENKNITNVATVDDEDTNETETPYDKPEIKEESTITKTGTEIINSTEDSITYQITYTANIKDFVGEGKVTLVDYLPYEIDVENQYLDGGLYDAKTKTITWEEDLGAIDTYTNGEKTVTLEKEITVKYVYGEDAETLEGTISNRVEGTLQLTQKDPENPTQDKTVLEDKKEATHETEVQIPTYIIVHHYIENSTTKVPSKV